LALLINPDLRGLRNVLFVHFGDLKSDLEQNCGGSTFCDIAVDEDAWPSMVASVGIDAMRTEDRGTHDLRAAVMEGGADRFFFKGTNGRWRDVLTDDDLALYDAAASSLDPVLRRWLEEGRHAVNV
jgi:aryl sulfotransferase